MYSIVNSDHCLFIYKIPADIFLNHYHLLGVGRLGTSNLNEDVISTDFLVYDEKTIDTLIRSECYLSKFNFVIYSIII